MPLASHPHVPLPPPPPPAAVYVDGAPVKEFYSRQVAPDGWYTAAPNAPPQAPFDAPFQVILNVAVGGTWPGPPDATTPFPATMAVEHVRVWGTPDD